MPYVCSVERIGIEKGLKQGLEQGTQQGQVRMLARQLAHRFGQLPSWVSERLGKASVDELEAWAEAVLSAESIETVFDAARH